MRDVDVETAAGHLRAGGLACFPTETLWSLSCRADDSDAVRRVFAAKGRPEGVPLAVGLADWRAAEALVHVTPLAQALAEAFLPGPLSLVLERRRAPDGTDRLAHVAPGFSTLSIRVPDHPLARAVLERAGPVVMTSANRHGQSDPLAASDVRHALADVPDLVLVGDEAVAGLASTVVDARGDAPVILRAGALGAEQLAAAAP